MTEIRTLADDEQISEPGFYNISLDRHHSQPCDGVSVTSGILRQMDLATPADVWAFHVLNPDRWEKPQTDALRLGRAMACYVEGGMAAVREVFLVLPADKPRRPTEQQKAAYRGGTATETGTASVEFWDSVDSDPRDPLSESDVTMISNMGKVLAADPAASAVMGGVPEITMAWVDQQTGLWCLARPDTINFDGTVTDFKKISTQGQPLTHRLVDRRIEQHAYHMQLAFAAEGFEQLTMNWPTSAGLIFQTDTPPHHVMLREVAEEHLRIGQIQNHRSLRLFRKCLDEGHWPGPGEDVGAWRPSEWFVERVQKMIEEGAAA